MSAAQDRLLALVGRELGVSAWHVVSQHMIDRFALVTGDDQFIHVDPVRAAAETPFGGTIAHGFLTLSLLSLLGREAIPPIEGRVMGINYGFDKVRFPAPVKAGARVRGRFVLGAVTARAAGEMLLQYRATGEIDGEAKPAVSAEWLALAVIR
jgi:acyl dehydratase